MATLGLFTPRFRPPTRRELAMRGVATLAVFALLAGILVVFLKGGFTHATDVTANLDTAGGAIVKGSDVKMHGLAIGRVAGISGDQDGVHLKLELDNASVSDIPRNVVARVLPASVFGTSYVELTTPNGPSATHIVSGAVIKQDTSGPTLELQQALDSVDRLVKALGPAELASALNSLSSSLDGNGAKLGSTIDRVDQLLKQLGPLMPTVTADMRLVATNLDTLQQAAPDLFDALDGTLDVAHQIVTRKAELTTLLAGGLSLVNDTDAFITKNQKKFVQALVGSARVVDALYDNRVGLREALLSTGTTLRDITTLGTGNWARVTGRVISGSWPYYTRADCPRFGNDAGGNCGGSGRAAPGYDAGLGIHALVGAADKP